jgi:hypothetical protein
LKFAMHPQALRWTEAQRLEALPRPVVYSNALQSRRLRRLYGRLPYGTVLLW